MVSYQTIVQLIAATTTKTGLRVRSELDANTYPTGIKVGDTEMTPLHDFHGDWNDTIKPRDHATRHYVMV